jgi:uncharacterized protein with HEPN domain
MQIEELAYLEDIRLAALDVIAFAAEIDAEAYFSDKLRKSAIERRLISIGEALSQLAKEFPETAQKIPDWRSIISLRNIIVHGYRVVDDDRVFIIVKDKVPPLLDCVAELILSSERPS